jgi:hypothetical protein
MLENLNKASFEMEGSSGQTIEEILVFKRVCINP